MKIREHAKAFVVLYPNSAGYASLDSWKWYHSCFSNLKLSPSPSERSESIVQFNIQDHPSNNPHVGHRTTNVQHETPAGLASKTQASAQQLIQQQCGHQPLPLGVKRNKGGLKLDLLMCSAGCKFSAYPHLSTKIGVVSRVNASKKLLYAPRRH